MSQNPFTIKDFKNAFKEVQKAEKAMLHYEKSMKLAVEGQKLGAFVDLTGVFSSMIQAAIPAEQYKIMFETMESKSAANTAQSISGMVQFLQESKLDESLAATKNVLLETGQAMMGFAAAVGDILPDDIISEEKKSRIRDQFSKFIALTFEDWKIIYKASFEVIIDITRNGMKKLQDTFKSWGDEAQRIQNNIFLQAESLNERYLTHAQKMNALEGAFTGNYGQGETQAPLLEGRGGLNP